jgi:hypothetical protein
MTFDKQVKNRIRRQRMFRLAEKIHALLCQHTEKTGSEEEATCALRVASALWVESPTASAPRREDDVPAARAD